MNTDPQFLAEKGGVDAVGVVAFAYDIYTTPSKNNGVLGATLTVIVFQGMSRRRSPKIQPRSGVPWGAWPSRPCRRTAGLLADQVATPVSFTVETTVLPSFARFLTWVKLEADPSRILSAGR